MKHNITLGEFYDKIKSYPQDTMNFHITDVFSWRGAYAEPCCSLSTEQTTKQENLDMLRRLIDEPFPGWKGGEFTYTFDDWIHFECDYGDYSSNRYLMGFLKRNKDSEIINHIFGSNFISSL
jgi:hypothetical protein